MTNEHPKFDFNEALKQLKAGKPLSGKSGILTPLIKELTEAALEGELESHLSQEISKNRKNGKSKKQIKSSSGCFELEVLNKYRVLKIEFLYYFFLNMEN